MQILAKRVEADGFFEVAHGVGVVRETVVGGTTIMISSHV